MKKLSGLQKEVLKLYRTCLRGCYKKPIENQENFLQYVRLEFRKNRKTIARKDYSTIEYLIRNGHRKFEMFNQDEIKDMR